MTLRQAKEQTKRELTSLYGDREAGVMTDWLLEYVSGKSRTARLLVQDLPMSEPHELMWSRAMDDLRRYRPIQYVTRQAWFKGLLFYVDERVLIPRPETEELVNWIITDLQTLPGNVSLLDVGTGSGCMPIAIKKAVPQSNVSACDISASALEVARHNADRLKADITWHELDILDESAWNRLGNVDIILSNPPYISQAEAEHIDRHVREFEPGLALFVPDNDPLLFYRTIARMARKNLKRGGSMYFEIHEDRLAELTELFSGEGFESVLSRKDLQGKNRMLKVSGPA